MDIFFVDYFPHAYIVIENFKIDENTINSSIFNMEGFGYNNKKNHNNFWKFNTEWHYDDPDIRNIKDVNSISSSVKKEAITKLFKLGE